MTEPSASTSLDNDLREIFQLVDLDGGGTSKCSFFVEEYGLTIICIDRVLSFCTFSVSS